MNGYAESGSPNILTVDYEDWFHILRRGRTSPSEGDPPPLHVEKDIRPLLDLLDRFRSRATFFLVGSLAERTPDLVRELRLRGHGLASHGYHHRAPSTMTEAEFRDDLRRSSEVIERIAGIRPRGYRAPGFGVRECPFSYLEVLRDEGIEYDSSRFPGVFPGRRVRGGPHDPHRQGEGIGGVREIPVSAEPVLMWPVVFSGGGFLRFLPEWYIRRCSRRVRRQNRPVVYYVHPRDLCPRSPTVSVAPWHKWRYYGGRSTVRRKMENLLRIVPCTSVETYLDELREGRLLS
ncbi:MAG: polysaccharide deacetylase family protein [Candidatus Eisenbacteria bacterium]